MWHSLFDIGIPVAEKIVRPFLIYVFLVVALRIAGKRELGQLNMLDFIVLLAVANAVQNGIIGDEVSITGAVIGASVLLVANWLVIALTIRVPKIRRLLIGSPSVLVSNGKVNKLKMRHERLSNDDVLTAVIEVGGTSINDAEQVILEPNGHLVVRLKTEFTINQQLESLEAQIRALSSKLDKR